MRLSPRKADALLPRIDPGRVHNGVAVGLRDGALLALVAAGLSAVQIASLRASDVAMSAGRVMLAVKHEGKQGNDLFLLLSVSLGAHLLAWLSERRLWGEDTPVFHGSIGPLSQIGVRKVLLRYARSTRNRRPLRKNRRSRLGIGTRRRRP